jgi:hypothetical protein
MRKRSGHDVVIGRQRIVCLAASVVLIVLGGRPSAADGPQPGLWKITTRSQMAGAPVRESSRTACLSAEAGADPYRLVLGDSKPQPGCEQFHELKADTLSWRTECSGGRGISGQGSMLFDTPQHGSGSETVTKSVGGMGLREGQTVAMTVTIEGRRIGDCSP